MTNARGEQARLTLADFGAYAAEVLTGSPQGRHWVAVVAEPGAALPEVGNTLTIDTPTGQRFRITITEPDELPG